MSPSEPNRRSRSGRIASENASGPGRRRRLDRQRVLDGALELADRIGVEALTIRRLADHLGVRPMSLYHYIENKEAILDGIVDRVFSEFALPPESTDWRVAMRVRCLSVRETLSRHPWATPLLESRRSPGPATLRHHDAVIGCLLSGGLPLDRVAHAYAVLDSFVYGFALQEAGLPAGTDAELAGLADSIIQSLPVEDYPNLRRFTTEHVLRPGYSFGHSFEFGLDLILEALAKLAPADL